MPECLSLLKPLCFTSTRAACDRVIFASSFSTYRTYICTHTRTPLMVYSARSRRGFLYQSLKQKLGFMSVTFMNENGFLTLLDSRCQAHSLLHTAVIGKSCHMEEKWNKPDNLLLWSGMCVCVCVFVSIGEHTPFVRPSTERAHLLYFPTKKIWFIC